MLQEIKHYNEIVHEMEVDGMSVEEAFCELVGVASNSDEFHDGKTLDIFVYDGDDGEELYSQLTKIDFVLLETSGIRHKFSSIHDVVKYLKRVGLDLIHSVELLQGFDDLDFDKKALMKLLTKKTEKK